MEYRRRRSFKGRKSKKNGGGALRAFILLVIFGASAYLLIAGGAGKRLKESLSSSVFDSCRGKTALTTPPPQITKAPATAVPATGAPSAAPTGETASVKVPGIDVFMLQMGVFQSEADCSAAAESIKARGAAGYVYEDDGVFRLIISAYSDEASAIGVKERLKEEGLECSVIRLSYSGAELLITASTERLTPIRTAFAMAYETVLQLDETAIDFDASQRSTEYALGVLSEIERNARTARAGIEDAALLNGTLNKVCGFYNDLEAAAEKLTLGSVDRAAFSSGLKYLRVFAALRYARLLSELAD